VRVGKKITLGILSLATLGFAGACGPGPSSLDQQREDSVAARTGTFDRAAQIAPLPQTSNFPLRRALVKFTERQDLINHPWFIYILGDNGNVVGYYVGQTVPINACNFLSSTEDVTNGGPDDGSGNVVVTAPSLDGIFYGGGGSANACDAWFFFDQTSDALIQIRGVSFFTADQPLRLDAKPIEVTTK